MPADRTGPPGDQHGPLWHPTVPAVTRLRSTDQPPRHDPRSPDRDLILPAPGPHPAPPLAHQGPAAHRPGRPTGPDTPSSPPGPDPTPSPVPDWPAPHRSRPPPH